MSNVCSFLALFSNINPPIEIWRQIYFPLELDMATWFLYHWNMNNNKKRHVQHICIDFLKESICLPLSLFSLCGANLQMRWWEPVLSMWTIATLLGDGWCHGREPSPHLRSSTCLQTIVWKRHASSFWSHAVLDPFVPAA